MTLFEIIIICVVAALVVATIFMFYIGLSYIRELNITNKRVLILTNAVFECRSFLEKLSKHEVIVKINKIADNEKKIGELIGICKNQTNNITQVREVLEKTLVDIDAKNILIAQNHKLLDNINGKISTIKDDTNRIGEFVTDINIFNFTKYNQIVSDITHIREKFGEINVDSEKEIIDISKELEGILSYTKRCKSATDALIEGHNKSIDATGKAFLTINDTLDNINDNINNVIKANKLNNDEIAKISYALNSCRKEVNYIITLIQNNTKLKTASKSKIIQTKTTATPTSKKGVKK